MHTLFSSRRLVLAASLVVLLLILGLAWSQRTPMLRWYYLRGLASADAEERQLWVERVASLDTAAIPGLLQQLSAEEERMVGNAEAALIALAAVWGCQDDRTAEVSEQLCQRFDDAAEKERRAILNWHLSVLQSKDPAAVTLRKQAVGLLRPGTARDVEVRERVLELAHLLTAQQPSPECLQYCRQLIQNGLRDNQPQLRRHALQLTFHTAFQAETELLRQLLPLLRDNSAEIRRTALLAIGSHKDMLSEEDLLPLLHDEDAEVRRLCEAALRSRGLQESHILLGRLISDPDPRARLQIVLHLPQATDIDPAIWLQRLSQDASPTVRAAAARLASTYPSSALHLRLAEMARTDANDTVRKIAAFYLGQVQPLTGN